MQLNGEQRKIFHESLLSAFPSKPTLKQMVDFELDENLDAIAVGENHSDTVFELINWARKEGKVKKLLTAARKSNPGNLELQSFEKEMRDKFDENPQPVINTSSSNREIPKFHFASEKQDLPEQGNTISDAQFDVFLCHNSKDKPEVKQIGEQLKQQGLKPWLDEWEFRPGLPWQRELETQIGQIKSAAVFVGSSGFGPWQEQELDAFLREFVKRQCPVIPVLLPTAPQQPKLPIFLQSYHWVDFRLSEPEPMGQLTWGITGIKPQNYQVPIIQPKVKPQIEQDPLPSEKGVDYTRLRDLLKAGKWKEADEETLTVMLKAAGKGSEDYLSSDDIKKFPCTDLRTIDQLWVKYSNGRFGFSVQKRIWESVGKDWDKFGDRVGWRKGMLNKEWLYYNQLTFSLQAPEGHLPVPVPELGIRIGGEVGGIVVLSGCGIREIGEEKRGRRLFSSLASRLVKCNI